MNEPTFSQGQDNFNYWPSSCSKQFDKVGFDIKFNDKDPQPIIESRLKEKKDLRGRNFKEEYCEVNTLCKIPHVTMNQKNIKIGYTNYIDKLVQKMVNINDELKKQKEAKNKITDENLKMIFNQENILERSKTSKREIACLKEAIKYLRIQIGIELKEKISYEKETIKENSELVEKQEELQLIKKKVSAKIKELAEIQNKVNEARRQVQQMKMKVGLEFGNVSNTFVKDVMSLIPSEKKALKK